MAWDRWLRRGAPAEAPVQRWLVLDVETGGLDATRDSLLAVAAVGVRADWRDKRLALVPGDSFEVVLRQQVPSSRENILLHGIGVQRQREGVPLAEGLCAFRAFAGEAPLLAFHAAFDETMLRRHVALAQLPPMANEWLDIEHLCAVALPEVPARSLDEWLAHFGIRCAVRHQAAADTWAECELLLRIWPRLAKECAGWRALRQLARQHRWVRRA